MWLLFLIGSWLFGCLAGYASNHLHDVFYGVPTFMISFFLSILCFVGFVASVIAYFEERE